LNGYLFAHGLTGGLKIYFHAKICTESLINKDQKDLFVTLIGKEEEEEEEEVLLTAYNK